MAVVLKHYNKKPYNKRFIYLVCLQLWHPLFLEVIRSTFTGSTLIGTTFVWLDFTHYVIGCYAGWFIIESKSSKNKYG